MKVWRGTYGEFMRSVRRDGRYPDSSELFEVEWDGEGDPSFPAAPRSEALCGGRISLLTWGGGEFVTGCVLVERESD